MTLASLILQMGGGAQASIPGLVASASPFSKGVLLLLLGFSVWSWAIIVDRLRLYGRVTRQDRDFLLAFRRLAPGQDFRLLAGQHPVSVMARAALAGQKALDVHAGEDMPRSDRWELGRRAMERSVNDELATLERHVGFLATTGSVAPFIGLMGTVWGVMVAFVGIGAQGSASLVVVAPGIAEALIATIAGLAAAIPAVVGYNHCLGRVREIGNAATSFTGEFLDRASGAPR